MHSDAAVLAWQQMTGLLWSQPPWYPPVWTLESIRISIWTPMAARAFERRLLRFDHSQRSCLRWEGGSAR